MTFRCSPQAVSILLKPLVLLVLLFASLVMLGIEDTAVSDSSNVGWGLNVQNHRYQDASNTEINRTNVHDLRLKWVFGLDDYIPRSYPHVTEEAIYIGSGNRVVALTRESGYLLWDHKSSARVTTAIVRDGSQGKILYFGEDTNGIKAIHIEGGAEVWKQTVEGAITPRYTGSPLVAKNKVFVPISSEEIGLSIVPFYGCCKSSGGLAALDAETGRQLWYLPTIQETAKPVGYGFLLTRKFAPSGAPVWSAPTYDPKRNLVYIGTGQNYSRPTTNTSDAILAVDANSGRLIWVYQATSGDAYTLACNFGIWLPGCFEPVGPDVDFGAPPVLATTSDGTELLFAGQKSGDVHALSPENGELVWKAKVGRGGLLGGVHFGLAADPKANLIFVPISDIYTDPLTGKSEARPGVHALDMETGELIWSHVREPECPQRHCWPGVSAAIIVAPGLVFGGTLDGTLFALDSETGEELWEFHADEHQFDAVNDIPTSGGSFDSHGPMVEGPNLFVSSGYGAFNQSPGNAFLTFELSANE